MFERKIVKNFLLISFDICFGCSNMFWWRNKKINSLAHTLNLRSAVPEEFLVDIKKKKTRFFHQTKSEPFISQH